MEIIFCSQTLPDVTRLRTTITEGLLESVHSKLLHAETESQRDSQTVARENESKRRKFVWSNKQNIVVIWLRGPALETCIVRIPFNSF